MGRIYHRDHMKMGPKSPGRVGMPIVSDNVLPDRRGAGTRQSHFEEMMAARSDWGANPIDPYVMGASRAAGPILLAVGMGLAIWAFYSFLL